MPRRVRIRIRRGLDLPVPGTPQGEVEAAAGIRSVGVLGADHPGLRLRPLVAVGDAVALGQPVLEDRRRPEIRVTAPGAGRVHAIHLDARRALSSLVIALGAGEERSFPRHEPRSLGGLPRAAVVERLCESGLWCALRARPFGKIPDPDAEPDAIFVAAIDTHPLAPPPELALAEHGEDFSHGLALLATLTRGPVTVCCRPGLAFAAPDSPSVVRAEFEGPHPSGLPGTHVHFLHRLGAGRNVFCVAYPDVIAIGKLFVTGRLWVERIVSVAGPAAGRPRWLRARVGASSEDLVQGAQLEGRCRIVSGSPLGGWTAAGPAAFLGRRHLQITALPEPGHGERAPWWGAGRGGRALRLLPARGASRGWAAADDGAAPGPFVPLPAFDRAVALDLPVSLLLRALVVGDVEAARSFGALELEPEDLALCSLLCPSGIDYGALLRRMLERLEAEL